MHIPISWLKQWLITESSTEELADRLTLAGIEVETMTQVGVYSPHVIAAVIEEKQQLAASSCWHLTCQGKQTLQVVTRSQAAAELAVGSTVALALSGAELFQEDGTLLSVKREERYDIMSDAVLCTTGALGIDNDFQTPYLIEDKGSAGQPLLSHVPADQIQYADEVLSVAILANIARCQSMKGVAKELAALLNARWQSPMASAEIPQTTTLEPVIEDDSLGLRLSLAEIHGVTVQASPVWMQKRLSLAGVRPINNVVDAGNYLMLSCGQPVHTYDLEKLAHTQLHLRASVEGDVLHTLAQTEEEAALVLQPGHPVISCDDKVVALAGVMGGTETAVDEQTQQILLEAAHFDLIAVRRSQTAHKLLSESSARFSRGVDPAQTLSAIEQFMALIRETCPAAHCEAIGDDNRYQAKTRLINLRPDQVKKYLGIDLSVSQLASLLARTGLETQVHEDGNSMYLCADSSRADLQESCDLVEEVARIVGFDTLPATMPQQPIPAVLSCQYRATRDQMRDVMIRSGWQEVINYHMTDPGTERAVLADEDAAYVEIINPASDARTAMRRTLLAGLLTNVADNLRYTESCQLFEIGRIFCPELESDSPLLPAEPYRLTAVMTGPIAEPHWLDKKPRRATFFDCLATAQVLSQRFYGQDWVLESATLPYYHPGCCARLQQAGKCFGMIGQLHPEVMESFSIEQPVYIMDVDCQLFADHDVVTYQALPRYPAITLDISLEVDDAITAQWLYDATMQHGGDWLRSVQVFDVYQGDDLDAGKKRMGMHLQFYALDKTLTMTEAVAAREHIVTALAQEFDAKLRDS